MTEFVSKTKNRKFSYGHFLRIFSDKKVSVEKDGKEKKEEGLFRFVVLICAFSCNMVIEGSFFSFGVIYDSMVEEFDVSRQVASWVGSFFLSLPYLLGPLSSAICSKFGVRFTSMSGSIIATLGWLGASYAQNMIHLGIALGLVVSTGFALVGIPTSVVIPHFFPKHLTLASSVAISGAGVGTFVIAPFVQTLMDVYNWRIAFQGMACLSTLMIVLSTSFNAPMESDDDYEDLPESPKKEEEPNESKNANDDYENVPPTNLKKNMEIWRRAARDHKALKAIASGRHFARYGSLKYNEKKILKEYYKEHKEQTPKKKKPFFSLGLYKNPIFLFFIIQNLLFYFALDSPLLNLPGFSEQYNVTEVESSYLLSAFGIANASFQIFLGWLGDRQIFSFFFTCNICLIGAGVSSILASAARTYWQFMLYSICFGALASANSALETSLFEEHFGLKYLSECYGKSAFAVGLATMFGPPVGGFVFDYFQKFYIVYIYCGLVMASSGAIMYLLPLGIFIRSLNKPKERKAIRSTGSEGSLDVEKDENV